MTGISETFERLESRGEAALIAYLTAGDPEPKYTPRLVEALINGGVDIIELGIPFSDPIADGPTIQAATVRALKAGTTPKSVIRMVGEIKNRHRKPIVLLTYFNIIYRMGLREFMEMASANRVDGLVVPDLPPEEAEEYKRSAEDEGIDTIFLAAPSTSNGRLLKILEYTTGFLYAVALFGVTGERERLQDSTINMVKRFLPYTKGRIPLAVGFGVSKPQHARTLAEAGADGIIVGSALVKIIEENMQAPDAAVERLRNATQNLKRSIKDPVQPESIIRFPDKK
ncbi:MAG: tryptophan synthase subunit alpha [Candidatus Bathyarchaeia archaeon]